MHARIAAAESACQSSGRSELRYKGIVPEQLRVMSGSIAVHDNAKTLFMLMPRP
jgi:hypothetical protein